MNSIKSTKSRLWLHGCKTRSSDILQT